jgi:hypothetical protein
MLQEKLAMLGLLRDGMSITNFAHKYGHNNIYMYIHITGYIQKYVRWLPCHHGMAHPQVVDAGDTLQYGG